LEKNIPYDFSDLVRATQTARDITHSISIVIDKPTPIVIARELFAMTNLLMKPRTVHPSDVFNDGGWCSAHFPFSEQLIEIIRECEYTIKSASDSTSAGCACFRSRIKGVDIGWIECTTGRGGTYVDSILYKGDSKVAHEAIMSVFWEKFENKPIVVHRTQKSGLEFLRVNVDEIRVPYYSSRSKELSDYFKKCVKEKVHRSILFYGPPGTGKTTLANTIVSNLGLKSVRFRLSDLHQIDPDDILELLSSISPDVVILDDIDHFPDNGTILEILEIFKRFCKLTMATVNNRGALGDASIRPGRFDEFIEVLQLDPDVVMNVLGPDFEKYFERVKNWPIVYIEEFKTRLKFQTESQAIDSMKELQMRISKSKRMYDESEEDFQIDQETTEDIVDTALTSN